MVDSVKASFTRDYKVYGPVEQGDPLTAWKWHAYGRGDLPIEVVTPQIVVKASQEEFAFLELPLAVPLAQVAEGIKRFAPWTYHFEVPGASTRGYCTYTDPTIVFHRHRANLINATITKMLGDRKSATALDLGGNCGFFSLDLAARGVGSVTGIDLRQENINQALFLRDVFGVKNVHFGVANVKDFESKKFDVILNLGLMYHLSTPFEVMRACFEMTDKFCVVDTVTHKEPFSAYHVLKKDPSISIEGDLSFELQPTYRGIVDTMRAAGFEEIVEIYAEVDDNVELYHDASRRCLLGFKGDSTPYIERLIS